MPFGALMMILNILQYWILQGEGIVVFLEMMILNILQYWILQGGGIVVLREMLCC